MSSATILPFNPPHAPARISVDKYHRMINAGIFTKEDRVELVEGWMIPKVPNSPAHATTAQVIANRLTRIVNPSWCVRVQGPITTDDSEPEPDVCVAPGDLHNYMKRHPSLGDIGLVVEVAYSSLGFDRNVKGRVYARAGVPVYWIANLDDQQIEAFSNPDADAVEPRYQFAKTYGKSEMIPLDLDGKVIAQIPVIDLLPNPN